MKTRNIILATTTAVALAGCGDSSLNPFSWFQSGPEVETLEEIEFDRQMESRPLVEDVTALILERRPGGVIVRATGLPSTQGWHSADLVAAGDGPQGGILELTFRAVAPTETTRVGTVQSRELVVAMFLSDTELEGAREIRVTGLRNIRSVRR
jgi:hypothetical protein